MAPPKLFINSKKLDIEKQGKIDEENYNGKNGVIAVLHAAVDNKQKLLFLACRNMQFVTVFRYWSEVVTIKYVRLDNGLGIIGVNVLLHVMVVSDSKLLNLVNLWVQNVQMYQF